MMLNSLNSRCTQWIYRSLIVADSEVLLSYHYTDIIYDESRLGSEEKDGVI